MLSSGQSDMMSSGMGQSAGTSFDLGQPGSVQSGMMPGTMDALLVSENIGGAGHSPSSRVFNNMGPGTGGGGLSGMSDAQLEAEIALLRRGGSTAGSFEADASGGLAHRSGGSQSLQVLQGPVSLLRDPYGGLGRDPTRDPVLSGSHPGLYPIEEMKPDFSHRLPFEGGHGQGAFDGMGGGGLPSQTLLGGHQDLYRGSEENMAMQALEMRKEALQRALG